MPATERNPRSAKPIPTGTVTFLFTDIEGTTRLWESQQAAMQAVLAEHALGHAQQSDAAPAKPGLAIPRWPRSFGCTPTRVRPYHEEDGVRVNTA